MTASWEASEVFEERRRRAKERRVAALDRRNEDRVAEDLNPRRNPELPDRRRKSSPD